MRYVLVFGSRGWDDKGQVEARLAELAPSVEGDCECRVIHGDCRGADRQGAGAAVGLGMRVKAFPADWKAHGRSAGYRRNQVMADFLVERRGQGHQVCAIGFTTGTSITPGTSMMSDLLVAAGIYHQVWDSTGAVAFSAPVTGD